MQRIPTVYGYDRKQFHLSHASIAKFILNKLLMKLYMGTAVSSIGTYIFIFNEE